MPDASTPPTSPGGAEGEDTGGLPPGDFVPGGSPPPPGMPDTAPPSGTPPGSPAPDDAGITAGAAMLGPGDSGKTNLAACIPRAAEDEGTDRFETEAIPADEATRKLHEAAIEAVKLRRPLLKTDAVTRYTFRVRVTRKATFWEPQRDFLLRLSLADGPGAGVFYGADSRDPAAVAAEKEMLGTARVARTIILTLDMNQPDTDVFVARLKDVLADASSVMPRNEPLLPFGFRIRCFFADWAPDVLRRRWRFLQVDEADDSASRGPDHRLAADRVLVLLTKVDDYVRDLHAGVGAATPAEIAGMLDPGRHLLELLGADSLRSIRRRMRPGARLAVAVTSAWGFDRYGVPLMNPGGRSAVRPPTSTTSPLREWCPFGVRDALIFVATGVAQGAVHELDVDAVLHAAKAPPIPALPLLSFRQPGLLTHPPEGPHG